MKKKRIHSAFQLASAVIMIVSLMWLTVNTPFSLSIASGLCMQQSQSSGNPANGSEDNNPLNNTTEEKVPSSNNFSEEYLHHSHSVDPFVHQGYEYHKLKNADTYTAYHGELLVPPPNFL